MRVVLSILLLFGLTSLDAHAQTSGPAARLPAQPPAGVPGEVQVPVRPAPAAVPQTTLLEEPVSTEQSAHAEVAQDAGQTQQQEPKKRSRVVWFLLGAVVVLTAVLVAS